MSQILVVDDQASNRDVLATLLGYYGHSVFEASDGVEGLSVAAREQPDLIISDVLMPTMDGYEFVRRLRQDPKLAGRPVVFYTAYYLEREALALAEKCGVSYVLRKPCEPSEVLSVIEGALGIPPRHAELPEEIAKEHLELITTRLSKTAEELARANLRLEALIEAGQKLATELHPPSLVDQYAAVARQIIGVDLCVIGILDKEGRDWTHVAASGLPDEAAGELHSRWKPDTNSPHLDFCAEGHLGVAVRTPKHFFGWLCAAGKLGGGSFSEDDERLARTLAAQLAVAYENAQLYSQVKKHAAELEERVRERTRDLEAAKSELESFTFAVSHDLRTPLHHLNGFSFLLEERFGPKLEPDATELVRRIHRTSREMADLVQSLLELSRISKQDIHFEDVPLNAVLEEALRDARAVAGERTIDWRLHPLPEVRGSWTLLKQVFANLLSNAVKFTVHSEAPVIEVGVITAESDPVIYIRDNGAGFDPQYADRLFTVFQRLHRQNEFPGTGAGLAIVQRIVKRHGGRIWAESAPGQGATFYFTLGASVGS